MISLCMIARDEERYLEACLKAALPAVDEIILVDTGSTDRTVEIAKAFGAKVHTYRWRDDFSAARNEALKRAKGDWILALDADEVLAEGAAEVIRRGVSRPEYCGYALPLVSPMDDGSEVGCYMVRLFVNRPEIRYRYLIHEQVIPDLNHFARRSGRRLGRLDARIVHHGYKSEAMNDHDKVERNRRLFLKQLEHYPRDVYSWYKWADFLRTSDAPREEAFEALERAWEILAESTDPVARSYSFAGEVAAYLALHYHERKDGTEKALEVVTEGARRFTPTPHLFFVKAGLERALDRLDDAIGSYRRCIAFEGENLLITVSDGITTYKALNGLGFCHLARGETREAAEAFERSIAAFPDQVEPYVARADAAQREGDFRDAIQWLIRLLKIRPDYTPAWNLGGEILERLGLAEQAVEWRSRAVYEDERRAGRHVRRPQPTSS